MKCVMCGNEMELRRETRPYDVGLDAPIIIQDVEVAQCSSCGEETLGIHNPEAIHRKVALQVATKKARLTPRELRFLRTHLGYCSADFARLIGVTPETVSRWERIDKPQDIGLVAERLLRLLVLTQSPRRRYPLDQLGTEAAAPLKMTVLPNHGKWVAAEAPDTSLWQATEEATQETTKEALESYEAGDAQEIDCFAIAALQPVASSVDLHVACSRAA